MTTTTRLATAALVGALAAACQIAAPPDPNAGIAPAAIVYSPVIAEQIGQIFPEADGLWAFRTDDATRARSYEPGQIVALGDTETTYRHLFVVTAIHDWGVRLQRLDSDPVESPTTGALVPITQLDQDAGRRWGFCAGEGDPRATACLEEAPAGTRWRLYPLRAGDSRLETSKERDRANGALPYSLRGLLAVGPLGKDLLGVDLPTRWLAVPTAPGPRPTRPRIAVARGCNVGSPHRDALDAEWLSVDVRPPTNTLETSAEAIRWGADAIVWCRDGQTTVAVPSLYRPRVNVIGRGFGAPPMLGAEAVTLPAGAAPAVDWVARLGAAISTGDWASADYLVEEVVRRFGEVRALDRVAVDAMVAVAEGGRPEAAARLGTWATRQQWNPENSPSWQLGMAGVQAALGNRKAAFTRTAGIAELFDRAANERRRAWFAYFWAISEVEARGKAGERLEPLKEYADLHLAARAATAPENNEALDALKGEFERAQAKFVWEALRGELSGQMCETQGCALDVYGRFWLGGGTPAAALSRVGRAELRPGFRPRPAGDEIAQLEELVALYPLLDDAGRQAAAEASADAARKWSAANCSTRSAKPDALRALELLGADAELRLIEPTGQDQELVWLARAGLQAACAGTPKLAAAAEEVAELTGRSELATTLLAVHVDGAPAGGLDQVLNSAAAFATKWERGPRCARWTVALAAAYSAAGDADRAQQWIREASHCDVSDRAAIDLVGAYLNFQRTSTTVADYADHIREALLGLVHAQLPSDVCAGAAELTYDIVAALPPDVQKLARALRPATVRSDSDEISLVTADDRLRNAMEELQGMLERVDARDYRAAAERLRFANDGFASVQNEVGVARTRWLDRVLFGGRAADVERGEAEFAKVGYAALRRKGTLTEAATGGDAVAKLMVAIAMSDGRAIEAATTAGTLPERPALCTPSARSERGAALEAVDGRLQPVGGTDDGPEIELAE